MNKRNIGIAALVLLLLIGATAWALWGRSDAQLEKVKQMQHDMANAPTDKRRERREELRKEMDKLQPAQRKQLRDERWAEGERHMDKRIADYFAAPPEKRKAMLDKEIQDGEKRRKEHEARRQQGGQGGPGGQGPNQPGRNPNGGPNPPQAGSGPGGQGGNAGGQSGRGRNASPEAQSANRNRRLDNSSPTQRAQRAAYFADMQKRRMELGLPPSPPHGHGRH